MHTAEKYMCTSLVGAPPSCEKTGSPVHKWLRINRALQAAEKRPPWRFVTVVHGLRRPARNETNVLRFVFVLFNLQRFWAEGAGAFRPGPCGVTCISVSF